MLNGYHNYSLYTTPPSRHHFDPQRTNHVLLVLLESAKSDYFCMSMSIESAAKAWREPSQAGVQHKDKDKCMTSNRPEGTWGMVPQESFLNGRRYESCHALRNLLSIMTTSSNLHKDENKWLQSLSQPNVTLLSFISKSSESLPKKRLNAPHLPWRKTNDRGSLIGCSKACKILLFFDQKKIL